MESIGQANVVHEFWDFPGVLAGLRVVFRKPQIHENIGLANIFHCFFMENHGKHWLGQCFP